MLAAGVWASRSTAAGVDVAAEARARKTSVEDAARTVRYLFLSEVAGGRGATRVAVGHTRDDQAETVLLRLARGAGPTGSGGDLSAGGPGRSGRCSTPAGATSRRGCGRAGQAWREDESNQDRAFARNKVRHELLPWLVEAFGAGVVDVLARQAALSRDDADWFELVATETAARLVIEEGTVVTLEPAALRCAASGDRPAGASCDRAAAAPRGGASSGSTTSRRCWRWRPAGSGAVDLPGQRVECRQGRLRFEPQSPDPAREGRRRGRPAGRRGEGGTHRRVGGVQAIRGSSGRRPAPGRRVRASGTRRGDRAGAASQWRAEVCRKC